MSASSDEFFEGKRPWSKIKDEILKNYLVPYLAKVNKRGQPILLIDGYAGPGIYEDGSCGSPIILCEEAERLAKSNYHAIFVNNKKKYHNTLTREIQQRGWSRLAEARLGDTQLVLREIPPMLKGQTLFLYLDPFGPKGCDFNLLSPFLKRDTRFSTEILLTMNMTGMHRLAGRHADNAERENIKSNRLILTQTFGGDYWREILLPDDIQREVREMQLIDAYRKKLSHAFEYTCACPVKAGTGKRIKYFVVLVSHHSDALILLNDIMVKAYGAGMHRLDFTGKLWEHIDWREMRSINGFDLDHIVLNTISKHPGKTREFIWLRIIEEHFMQYLKSEYIHAVKQLVDARKLTFSSKTNRLNDESVLRPYNL